MSTTTESTSGPTVMPPAQSAFTVSVTETRKKHTPLVVGVITAGALTENFAVDVRDNRHQEGYQRPLSVSRVNKLMDDLKNTRVDLPTAVLLNLREYVEGKHLVEDGPRWVFRPNATRLHVVDGQHRIEALSRLVRGKDGDRWRDFEIPFACLLGASVHEEMEQFYIVNSTAKSVRTDLAYDLLKQRAEADPEVMQSIIESGQDWKVEGQRLAEALADSEIWRNRIRFPGQEKGATTINSSGMVNSLRPLLSTPYFGALDMGHQKQILDAYWRGIRNVLPDAFADPTEYTLQKVTGVQVMHLVLVPAIEYIRSTGQSVLDPESYADALTRPLMNLQETTATDEIVSGAPFWRAGPDGAAGSFSSNAGRRVLTARIKSALPTPEVI